MRSKEFFRRSKVSIVEKALFATFDLLKKVPKINAAFDQ
jgi:hypothetical protein